MHPLWPSTVMMTPLWVPTVLVMMTVWQIWSLCSSCYIGITSSCLLLAFPLLVRLVLSPLHCLCFLVSRTRYSAILIVAIPLLKAAVRIQSRPTQVKSHGNSVHDVIIAHKISGDTQSHKQTDMENVKHS